MVKKLIPFLTLASIFGTSFMPVQAMERNRHQNGLNHPIDVSCRYAEDLRKKRALQVNIEATQQVLGDELRRIDALYLNRTCEGLLLGGIWSYILIAPLGSTPVKRIAIKIVASYLSLSGFFCIYRDVSSTVSRQKTLQMLMNQNLKEYKGKLALLKGFMRRGPHG